MSRSVYYKPIGLQDEAGSSGSSAPPRIKEIVEYLSKKVKIADPLDKVKLTTPIRERNIYIANVKARLIDMCPDAELAGKLSRRAIDRVKRRIGLQDNDDDDAEDDDDDDVEALGYESRSARASTSATHATATPASSHVHAPATATAKLPKPFHYGRSSSSGYTSMFIYVKYPFFGVVGEAIQEVKKNNRQTKQIYSGICFKSSDLDDFDGAEFLRSQMVHCLVYLDDDLLASLDFGAYTLAALLIASATVDPPVDSFRLMSRAPTNPCVDEMIHVCDGCSTQFVCTVGAAIVCDGIDATSREVICIDCRIQLGSPSSLPAHARSAMDRARLDARMSTIHGTHSDFKTHLTSLALALKARTVPVDESDLKIRFARDGHGPFGPVFRQVEPIFALKDGTAMMHPDNIQLTALCLGADLSWCHGSVQTSCILEAIRTDDVDANLEASVGTELEASVERMTALEDKMARIVEAECQVAYHRLARAKMSLQQVNTAFKAIDKAAEPRPTPTPTPQSKPKAQPKQATLQAFGVGGGIRDKAKQPVELTPKQAAMLERLDNHRRADNRLADATLRRLTEAIEALGWHLKLSKLDDGSYNVLPGVMTQGLSFKRIMAILTVRVKRTIEVCNWQHLTDPNMSPESHYMTLAFTAFQGGSDDFLRGVRLVVTPRAPNGLSFGHKDHGYAMRSGARDMEICVKDGQVNWVEEESNIVAESWTWNRVKRNYTEAAVEEIVKALRGLDDYDENVKWRSKRALVIGPSISSETGPSVGDKRKRNDDDDDDDTNRKYNEIGDAYRAPGDRVSKLVAAKAARFDEKAKGKGKGKGDWC